VPKPVAILTRLLIAGLIGAVVTVGVAWYAVVRGQWAKTEWNGYEPTTASWPINVPESWGRPEQAKRASRWAWSLRYLESLHPRDPRDDFDGTRWVRGGLMEYRAGWPVTALKGCTYHGVGVTGDGWFALWRIELGSSGKIFLPLSPIWPSFGVNMVLYAALVWGLYRLPPAIRGRSRRRAGRCMRCGYDRAGLAAEAACPECGEAKYVNQVIPAPVRPVGPHRKRRNRRPGGRR
jgi:hypothetical protein